VFEIAGDSGDILMKMIYYQRGHCLFTLQSATFSEYVGCRMP
jgi:ABC-type microcin C transport system permease subunit YejE